MSRIGKQPVVLPKGVKANLTGDALMVEGPKGKLNQSFHPVIALDVKPEEIIVTKKEETPESPALFGLTRALVQNMVTGVSEGFSKTLEIVGVGYRAEMKGSELVLAIGYSHPVAFKAPEGISIKLEGANTIIIEGIDRQKVGQVAADIRAVRKPEPYKGKGIKYRGENILRKAGKTGV